MILVSRIDPALLGWIELDALAILTYELILDFLKVAPIVACLLIQALDGKVHDIPFCPPNIHLIKVIYINGLPAQVVYKFTNLPLRLFPVDAKRLPLHRLAALPPLEYVLVSRVELRKREE